MSDHNDDDPASIQRQIHAKKTSILDSTRRMLGLVNESEVVGNSAATVSSVLSLGRSRTCTLHLIGTRGTTRKVRRYRT
jgi:hypothetical protein